MYTVRDVRATWLRLLSPCGSELIQKSWLADGGPLCFTPHEVTHLLREKKPSMHEGIQMLYLPKAPKQPQIHLRFMLIKASIFKSLPIFLEPTG